MNKIANELRRQLVGDDLSITSLTGAIQFDQKFIELREASGYEITPHYRGEQKLGWDIIPGIFRKKNLDGIEGKKLEQKAIQLFEKRIKERYDEQTLRTFFNRGIYGKGWDLLFQAQHARIKTALTDWTLFICIALYFATEKSTDQQVENSDGQLWCLLMPDQKILIQHNENDPRSIFKFNPFDIRDRYLINPVQKHWDGSNKKRIFEDRMSKQGGRFLALPNETCHVPINQCIEMKDYLIRIRIPTQSKSSIRDELEKKEITKDWIYVDENNEMETLIKEINEEIFGVS